MRAARRKIGFVLAASSHGPLIVDRFDYHRRGDRQYGVGSQILENSSFDPDEIDLIVRLLGYRRQYFGDGVVMVDCGANIGVHTIECAIAMTGWGSLLAVEAQERLFYALAGNVALNNCFNARVMHAAVGAESGTMRVPVPDYLSPGSFGSLEMKERAKHEFIGQKIDYSVAATQEIRCLTLDSLALARVDFVKVDVEGMEQEVLAGARELIAKQRPLLLVEWIKSGKSELSGMLEGLGYHVFEDPMNLLAVHPSDPTLGHVRRR